jgi:CCR4-NOT transcription complex subunit 6
MHSPGSFHPMATASASSNAAMSSSPHWQQQLLKADISRQSASPHHHARAAALAARSATSSAVAIQDPAKGGTIHVPRMAANGLHVSSSGSSLKKLADLSSDDSEADSKDGQSWTTIDMGGLGLKNIAKELFRYTFLTSLFINHNALTSLAPEIVQLRSLVILDASGNKLTNLPAELGMLTSLKELFLFDNKLSTLPSELGTLHQLETLGIEGNPLQDNLRQLMQKDGTQALIAYLRDSCPVPLPPPEREWIAIEPDLDGREPEDDDAPIESFNVLTYNVLCDRMATAQMYGYTPSWALAWEYRKEFILQEVMSYGADFCCMQEVASSQYEDYFLHHLSQQDYEGIFAAKTRARTMREEERKVVDGCAIFYKSTKYALIERQVIEFNQAALRRADLKKTEDMFNRVMTKDEVAVVALLENKESGSRLIVANVHMHWDPEFRDVKLVQAGLLLDELERIGQRFAKYPAKLDVKEGFPPAPHYDDGNKIPTILCGDFNSMPGSGVYEFLSRGSVKGSHEDFMNYTYGDYTANGLQHHHEFKSAYAHIGELPFTNYTPNFDGVLDYIWFNSNALTVTGLLGEVDKSYLDKCVGFPNAHFPSDHICILGEFRVKHPRSKAATAKAGNTQRANGVGSGPGAAAFTMRK